MPAQRDPRSGRWRYRKVVRLPDGTKKRIGGTPTKNTKRAAEEAESQHIARETDAYYARQYSPDCGKKVPTFSKWFNGRFWREWVVARKNKPSEQESKRSIYEVHLRERFGEMLLHEIGPGEIAQLRADLIESGLSDKRINNILAVLSKALRYAESVKLIESVPAMGMLKVERPEVQPWEFEQYPRILDAAREEGRAWYAAACLAGEAGLRIGEIKALRWREDVDLVAETITVNQQIRKGVVGTPKGRTRRTILMTPRLVRALRQLEAIREGHVVRTPDGCRLRDGQSSHAIRRVYRRAGLPIAGWHALRHTFGTHAAMFGVNPWRLMQWMGHKRIDETLLYVHLVESHPRPLPPELVTAGEGIADPDRRVLAMLGERGDLLRKRANHVPTTRAEPSGNTGTSAS